MHTFRVIQLNPFTGGGGVKLTPFHFFNVAQKPFKLFTHKFVTFPNMSSIDHYFVYFTGIFCRQDRFRSLQIMSDRDCNPINDEICFGRF